MRLWSDLFVQERIFGGRWLFEFVLYIVRFGSFIVMGFEELPVGKRIRVAA